jgi:nitrous oxidase accessory protein NosD
MPALLTGAVLATLLIVGVLAVPAQAALRHIDGTVVSKNSADRTFRIATQNGNRIRIKVNATTKFERLAGFGGLHKGLRIEVDAQKTADGLVAKQIELRGGVGGGDSGGGGGDDGPNHT